MQKVKVYAPASIGNLGPGFDVIGLAISNCGDTVEAFVRNKPGVGVLEITGDGGRLPLEPEKNAAAIAAMKVLEKTGSDIGIDLKIHKGVSFPSGLGSSAASAVAGGFAANELVKNKLEKVALLEACTEGEAAVSGGAFADNTGASLFGGCVLTKCSEDSIRIVPLGTIPELAIILATPMYPMPTKKSRAVLPKEVPLGKFVSNMSSTAFIVAAFLTKNINLLEHSIEDLIIEPARKSLIPGFDDVKNAAMDHGAMGCSISGGGSSVFAIARNRPGIDLIGESMKTAFMRNGLESVVHICSVDELGTRVIE